MNIKFTIEIAMSSIMLSLVPGFLEPCVSILCLASYPANGLQVLREVRFKGSFNHKESKQVDGTHHP
jgi:hypothetical protein